jgi:hypothetical protein
VKKLTFTPILRFIVRKSKAQAMAEFLLAAAVAMVILFVAIQFAVIARDAMLLGQLNYQVTRWATDSPNNHGVTVTASPQCDDVVNFLKTTSYGSGQLGPIINKGVACGNGVPSDGINVAMTCSPAACAGLRPAGTEVKITLTMTTKQVLFLTGSGTSFFGIPFPSSLSSSHAAYTQ